MKKSKNINLGGGGGGLSPELAGRFTGNTDR
jgi:hypothetical protein